MVKYACLGMWLSWLARFAHIEEVGGSSPFIPTKHRGTRRVPLCLVMSTGLEAGGNKTLLWSVLPGRGAKAVRTRSTEVQAEDDLSGESLHPHQAKMALEGAFLFDYVT